TGLDFLIAYANINEDDVYTIGDGHNDILLIEFGVHGSVMSCADEDVKEHAQVEYDSVSDLISKNM
ncbi:HAD hydrolase family protein, partial [Holdemanella sp.]|uniref:HAD hydrolase family protein n=1 Tax=Holdemanella sp. TaxID=1971762 RepID=UPI003077353E